MKLGYEVKTGVPVDIPITHTVFSALTGGGKTEAVIRLITEAAKLGYTVLAIDVKAKPRDFEGVGKEIRPILIESTEALLVMRMLESVAGAGLFSRFSAILDASIDAKTLKDVLKNFETIRDNKKAYPRKRDDAKVLGYLLSKLLEQIKEGDYAQDLDFSRGVREGEPDAPIYVMNISQLPLGVQELVVDSVFRRLLSGKFERTVVVLEEAINFIPQAEATQFETSARKFIREGRSAELFLWASGQALTEMDIAVRKQMRVWILGPQMEEREAEKFRKQVPMKGVEAHEIQKLPTGHFIAAIRRAEEQGGQVDVVRVYAQPIWLPEKVAIRIAKGEETLKDAMRYKRVVEKLRKEGKKARDMDEKERRSYEDIIQAKDKLIEELQHGQDVLRDEIASVKKQLDEAKTLFQTPETPTEQLAHAAEIHEIDKRMDAELENIPTSSSLGFQPSGKVKLPVEERDDLRSVLPPGTPTWDEIALGIDLDTLARKVADMLGSKEYQLRVGVSVPLLTLEERKVEIRAEDTDIDGRFALLIAEGFFDEAKAVDAIRKEAKERGWGTYSGGSGWTTLDRVGKRFAVMGFLRNIEKKYIAIPEAKKRIKRVKA